MTMPIFTTGGTTGRASSVSPGSGLTIFSSTSQPTGTSSGTPYTSLGSLPGQNTQWINAASQNAASMALRQAQTLEPYVAQQFYQNLERAFPGYQQIVAQSSANTQAMLQGRIPSDVADMIRMVSAEQGVQGAHASTARNLGLTSLDISQRGFAQATGQAQMSRYLMPPTMDVYGAATNLQQSLISRTTLDPAAALQGAIALRGQDIQASQFAANASFRERQFTAGIAQANTQMDWARELSAMNRQYENWQYNTELQLMQETIRTRAQEQESMSSAFNQLMSTMQTRS